MDPKKLEVFDDAVDKLDFPKGPLSQETRDAIEKEDREALDDERARSLLEDIDLSFEDTRKGELTEAQREEITASCMGTEVIKSVLLNQGTTRFVDENWQELSASQKEACEKAARGLSSFIHEPEYQAFLIEAYGLQLDKDFDFTPNEQGPVMSGARAFLGDIANFQEQKKDPTLAEQLLQEDEGTRPLLERIIKDDFRGTKYMNMLLFTRRLQYVAYKGGELHETYNSYVKFDPTGEFAKKSYDEFEAEVRAYEGYAIAHHIYETLVEEFITRGSSRE